QKDCPARSCFAVKDLPMGVKVEVEAIAHIAR
ncbi:MAG: Rid family hydrolase, partial [Aeromonas veronii]